MKGLASCCLPKGINALGRLKLEGRGTNASPGDGEVGKGFKLCAYEVWVTEEREALCTLLWSRKGASPGAFS